MASYVFGTLLKLWRGEYDLAATVLGGGFVTWLFCSSVLFAINRFINFDNYRGDFILREWILLFAVLVYALGPIWWSSGLIRCSIRYQRERGSVLKSFLAFVVASTMMLTSVGTVLRSTGEWLLGWWDTVNDKYVVVNVRSDPIQGRLVLRGRIGFGSYKVLEAALKHEPKSKLIEIESPGGIVVEGLAMARLIQQHGLDTLSLEDCASACTLLLAAGNERYVGRDASIGFHRTGVDGHSLSTGWTDTDYKIAEYYKSRGASQDFIKHALDTPNDDIWTPGQWEMLDAGFVTKKWEDRNLR